MTNANNTKDQIDKTTVLKADFAKRIVDFTVDIIKFIESNLSYRHLRPVFDQLLRSASSIGANITEAHGTHTKKEFARYFNIALASAKETKYWLLVLSKIQLKNKTLLSKLLAECSEFIKIIGASVNTMRKMSRGNN